MGTTANYSLPYPEPTGAVQPDVDIKALAQSVDTQLLNVNTLLTPVEVTTTASIFTSPAGWTATDGRAVTILNGKMIALDLTITSNGTTVSEVATGTGNISPDVVIGTLLTAYRPTHVLQFAWDNGTVGGTGVINADGTVNLRTITGNSGITTATNLRISVAFIRN